MLQMYIEEQEWNIPGDVVLPGPAAAPAPSAWPFAGAGAVLGVDSSAMLAPAAAVVEGAACSPDALAAAVAAVHTCQSNDGSRNDLTDAFCKFFARAS